MQPTANVSKPQHQRTPSSTIPHALECVESTECQHDTLRPLQNPSSGPLVNSSPAASAAITTEKLVSNHTVSRTELLKLIIKQTAVWVLGGIGMMMVGTGLARAVILPRIHTCQFDTDCASLFGVGVTNAITLLQTLMHYWLQVGMVIASVGLLKLSAYQAWFILMHNGNTIDNLDLNLGAVRGNVLDAARLYFRKRGQWFSAYVLGQLGISTAISLIVGLSITREGLGGTHTFTYPSTIQFPDIREYSSDIQKQATTQVTAWAVLNDTSHASAYRGSLVIPDARNVSTNSAAGGPRIRGILSCTGVNNYNITMDGKRVVKYNMRIDAGDYPAYPGSGLAVTLTNFNTTTAKYIWASDTMERLLNLNATQTSDGMMHMALCTHNIFFREDDGVTKGVQKLEPSTPITPGCPVADPNVCVSAAVNLAIRVWWDAIDILHDPLKVNCRGSVLGPLPTSGVFQEDNCPLTEELWSETVTSILDGLVHTGRKGTDVSTQTLLVPIEAINVRRWWLQALIPFVTLVLYGIGLSYTATLSKGRNILKELTLTEIIGAAQTEYVRALLDSGSLEKAMVRYESETGFTLLNPSQPRKHRQPPNSTNIQCVESNKQHCLENSSLRPLVNFSSAASATITMEKSAPDHTVSRTEVVSLIIKRTVVWVLGGIGVMIVGTGIARAVILPRIHTCLFDTDCSLPFGVGVINAITLLQTLMNYWLQAGMLVASVGLLKLSAYQAWFILMNNGNTIDNLDLNLGAIRGNVLDAARLYFRKRGQRLSVYVLGQLGISAAISLIIGLSIIRGEGGPHTFTYSNTIQFPDYAELREEVPMQALEEVTAWAVINDTSHSSAYRGSLVIPDTRNISTNSGTGGPRIRGTLSCTGINDYNVTLGINDYSGEQQVMQYNMRIDGREFSAVPGLKLAVTRVSSDMTTSKYIWVSNSTDRLPNATQTNDGMMHMALCTHSIFFVEDDASGRMKGVQILEPSAPLTPGCSVADPNVCVSAAVNLAIKIWWGPINDLNDPPKVNCRGSVLGPLPTSGVFEEDNCPLTEELWSETVTSVLDGFVRTGDTGATVSTQTLIVPIAAINVRRWWLQALIPFLTLVLYGIGVAYTTALSRGRNTLKELNLTEVIEAAQTDHVRTILESGSLAKAMVQYENETGFTLPNPSRPGKRRIEKDAVVYE